MMRVSIMLLGIAWIVAVGCVEQPAKPNDPQQTPEITNRIPVPPEVIANIGITFEKATRGKVGEWLRVPGRLEVPEDRRWTLRASAEGRIRCYARPGELVTKDYLLFALESPALRAAQTRILDAVTRQENAESEAGFARERYREAETLWEQAKAFEEKSNQRWQRLNEVLGEGSASRLSARERLAAEREWLDARERTLEAAVHRDDLRIRSRQRDLDLARAQFDRDEQIDALAVLTGDHFVELTGDVRGKPRWQTLGALEIVAPEAGIVTSVAVAEGEHVAAGTAVATLVDPSMLVFRGTLPESDLARVKPEASLRITAAGADDAINCKTWPAPPEYDARSRTLRVSAWVPNPDARFPDGLSATAQLLVAESGSDEVIIPEACVIFDGLEAVVFRRDPADPGVVIRTPVELGRRGAGFVAVLSGVLDDDEIVRDGIYQLKETGTGKAPPGGHFHADGTWHGEEH